ncbi:MAG TPA: PDZ domain-containing protein, partial [Abditibacteriaceae bacterium]|nr:PDZ domain-containing protein [Abditibacteriaceae bacterium]
MIFPKPSNLLAGVLTPLLAVSIVTIALAQKQPSAKTAVPKAVVKALSKPVTPGPALAGWSYQLEEDELESAWTWMARLEANGPFETRIVFHYQNPQSYLMLRLAGDAQRATARFWRVTKGSGGVRVEKLGESDTPLLAPRGQLTLQRSAWRVRALWNGHPVVSAFSNQAGARLGVATHGAAKILVARLQPTEPPTLRDDFMRAQGPDDPEIPGEWRRVAGVWKTSGMLGPRADVALNPNPFVFRAELPSGVADGAALATVGKWFWSDYSVTASVRPHLKNPAAPLVAGVSAYNQPEGANVSGVVDFRSGRASIRVGNRTLATGAPFAATPDQWHRLFLDPGPGTLRLIVDGVERVRVESAGVESTLALAQGPAALQASLGGGNLADFDDVRIDPSDAVSDDFRTVAVGRWDDARGAWQTRSAGTQGGARGMRVKISAGLALTLTGSPEREEGLVEAKFANLQGQSQAQQAGAVGVAFAARDARNYFTARLRAGQLEIVEYTNGNGKILASVQASPSASSPGLSVAWREGIITARAAATRVVATVNAVPAGRVGVWADGAASTFAVTSFHALGVAPSWGEGSLPERIQKDRLMKNWASNAAAWKPGKDGVWWHTGDFFQDASLSIPLPELQSNGSLTLRLGADPGQSNVGARLTLKRLADAFSLELMESGRAIKSVALPLAGAKGDVRFVRRPLDAGKVALRVAVGGRVLIAETATANRSAAAIKIGVSWSNSGDSSTPARARTVPVRLVAGERDGRPHIGVQIDAVTEAAKAQDGLPDLEGAMVLGTEAGSSAAKAGLQSGDVIRAIDGKQVRTVEDVQRTIQTKKAGASLVLQIARKAPTLLDWEKATAGTAHLLDYTFTTAPVDWHVGKGRWEVAERWTCQPQWGFFAGSNSVNPTLWSRFAVSGDFTLEAYLATPMDLTRGERSPTDLNLTVGGDGHDLASGYSFLFAARKRASNRLLRGDAVVVDKPFELPPGVGNTHQDWFYVRLERRSTPQGLHFRYSVNGREIINYTDPQPLPSALEAGRIAFWTYNGGLSIARARLWYSNVESGGQDERDNKFNTTLATSAAPAT